jgi:transposase-like protein
MSIDKSPASAAAIAGYNANRGAAIELRQLKYLNNIVEQDHRAIKRIVSPITRVQDTPLRAPNHCCIETMHTVRKGHLACPKGQVASAAAPFCSLAFQSAAMYAAAQFAQRCAERQP